MACFPCCLIFSPKVARRVASSAVEQTLSDFFTHHALVLRLYGLMLSQDTPYLKKNQVTLQFSQKSSWHPFIPCFHPSSLNPLFRDQFNSASFLQTTNFLRSHAKIGFILRVSNQSYLQRDSALCDTDSREDKSLFQSPNIILNAKLYICLIHNQYFIVKSLTRTEAHCSFCRGGNVSHIHFDRGGGGP